jgi:Amt family ammonium transporter
VGAISVHGVCGTFGTLAVGLFAADGGLFTTGNAALLGIQALGVVTVFAWVFGTASLLFLGIRLVMGLRVSKEEELKGLDIEEHGIESYSGFQIFLNQ